MAICFLGNLALIIDLSKEGKSEEDVFSEETKKIELKVSLFTNSFMFI